MKCKYLENQVTIRSDGQYRLCCVSVESNNKENIRTHTPIEWRDSETYTYAKKQLGCGEWPDACIKCKTQEELGLESKRTKARSFGPGISHLDLRLGNSCNLRCLSCWNMSSSSIAEEQIEMKKAGIAVENVLDISNFNWADEDTFKKFEDLPLQEVYLTGGEPMMVRHLPYFLERLDPSTHIRFSTNCTIWNTKLEKILRKFDVVTMSLSLDAVDRKIEYIRYGSKWSAIEDIIERYRDFCMVNIAPTISLLNAWFYEDIQEYADKKRWRLYENVLMFPLWLHCKNAPESLKEKFQILNSDWYNGPADKYQIKYFKEHIIKLDNWRNIKISDYLPPVAKAYGIN
jgi:MoaA/NifB/PqqE/SkfB family radical SAM enzyme